MVEICDTILYSRCGNPTTDVILTAPVLWAPRHYNTLVTNALNPPKTRNFTNFPKYISADSHNFRFQLFHSLNNQYFCKWTNANSTKIFGGLPYFYLTSIIDTYTRPNLVPLEDPAKIFIGLALVHLWKYWLLIS